MKHSLFTNTVILLLGCHAGVWADTSFSFFNTWELYDDNEEFIGMTISEDYRTSSSLTFQLTDPPEAGYDVNIDIDGAEGESPDWYELTSFTLMSCNAESGTELWGVVTDRAGSIVASALATAKDIGEAVVFDFSKSAPVLQAATSYTLYFVNPTVEESEITIGSPFNASAAPLRLGIAWTTDGWEDENGEWVNSYPESDVLKYNDEEGDSDGNAPAVYITATGYPAPEPTTSALSLLALAGFALRRRRS